MAVNEWHVPPQLEGTKVEGMSSARDWSGKVLLVGVNPFETWAVEDVVVKDVEGLESEKPAEMGDSFWESVGLFAELGRLKVTGRLLGWVRPRAVVTEIGGEGRKATVDAGAEWGAKVRWLASLRAPTVLRMAERPSGGAESFHSPAMFAWCASSVWSDIVSHAVRPSRNFSAKSANSALGQRDRGRPETYHRLRRPSR